MNEMKHFVLMAGLMALSLASCQPKPAASGPYVPQTTEPMELMTVETIALESPDTMGGDALMRTMQNRRSTREFSDKNLSLKHLSEILWAANGVNRPDGKRVVPSAMALYPLETYAFLANGIYRYDPAKHELQRVVEGDHRELAGMQPFVATAPLNLVFIADYEKYRGERPLPVERHLHMAALDAGHCTQSVYLYCASEGLNVVVRGGAQERAILDLLNLNDGNHQFVVAQTIGYPGV